MSEPLSSDIEVKPSATASDVFDILNDDKDDKSIDLDKPTKPKPKADKEEEDDDDDDKGTIELKEDEDDEKLDLKEKSDEDDDFKIDTPPRKKEIQAKYPNFFKEFPFFEKLMFRDRQYTELFGSFDDAKDIVQKARTLDNFEGDILNGNTEHLLSSVKNTDRKAFDKIVDDYLPTLGRVDKEAYFEVIGNVGKHIIKEMVTEGRNSNNEELQQAALFLNQFLFGSSTYTPPKPRVEKQSGTQDEQLEQERINFTRERFETSRNELQVKVDNVLRSTISEHIDPKGEMSSYVKKNAIRDALTMLHSNIGEDAAFRKNLDRLWEAAFSSRFDQQSLNRIRAAYLGRSKQVLVSVIKRARSEAFKDMTPSSRVRDEDEEERTPRRGPISTGRPHQSSGKLKMEKGESVMDFLSRD